MITQERMVEGMRECTEVYGFGEKIEFGNRMLHFALCFDLLLATACFCFIKKDEHFIAFNNGFNSSQWICS